jgi:hypothetical protein
MLTTRAWEVMLQDAVHEADPMMAEVKIRRAEAAIFNRIHHFSASPNSTEEQALFDALVMIRLFRTVRRLPNTGTQTALNHQATA